MEPLALRRRVTRALLEFAWDEWAQMGVLAAPSRESPWAADPEAHLLFTFQVGRSDPRLFDEVLDWLATNSALISAQRLRNLVASRDDDRLVEAALAWTARRLVPRKVLHEGPPERIFYEQAEPRATDEAFAAYGFLKPSKPRSGKSRRPDQRRSINFAYRLRSVFGVGSRAEVFRFLLTAGAQSPIGGSPLFTTAAIADAAAFAKRNVQEALTALSEAGAIALVVRGNEHVYAIDRDVWTNALRLDGTVPQYRDWPHVLLGFRELHRWLWRSDLERLTPYMLASEARLKMGEIETAFTYGGMPVRPGPAATGEEYWDAFVELVSQLVDQLESGLR